MLQFLATQLREMGNIIHNMMEIRQGVGSPATSYACMVSQDSPINKSKAKLSCVYNFLLSYVHNVVVGMNLKELPC